MGEALRDGTVLVNLSELGRVLRTNSSWEHNELSIALAWGDDHDFSLDYAFHSIGTWPLLLLGISVDKILSTYYPREKTSFTSTKRSFDATQLGLVALLNYIGGVDDAADVLRVEDGVNFGIQNSRFFFPGESPPASTVSEELRNLGKVFVGSRKVDLTVPRWGLSPARAKEVLLTVDKHILLHAKLFQRYGLKEALYTPAMILSIHDKTSVTQAAALCVAYPGSARTMRQEGRLKGAATSLLLMEPDASLDEQVEGLRALCGRSPTLHDELGPYIQCKFSPDALLRVKNKGMTELLAKLPWRSVKHAITDDVIAAVLMQLTTDINHTYVFEDHKRRPSVYRSPTDEELEALEREWYKRADLFSDLRNVLKDLRLRVREALGTGDAAYAVWKCILTPKYRDLIPLEQLPPVVQEGLEEAQALGIWTRDAGEESTSHFERDLFRVMSYESMFRMFEEGVFTWDTLPDQMTNP